MGITVFFLVKWVLLLSVPFFSYCVMFGKKIGSRLHEQPF